MKSGALPSSVIVASGSRGRGRDSGGTVEGQWRDSGQC